MLIICDWTSTDFLPEKPVTVLRDALTKWDVGAEYKNPPFLLEGGFQKFLFAYPHNVTNPKARAPSEPKSAMKPIMPSLDFDYPDLDNGEFLPRYVENVDFKAFSNFILNNIYRYNPI